VLASHPYSLFFSFLLVSRSDAFTIVYKPRKKQSSSPNADKTAGTIQSSLPLTHTQHSYFEVLILSVSTYHNMDRPSPVYKSRKIRSSKYSTSPETHSNVQTHAYGDDRQHNDNKNKNNANNNIHENNKKHTHNNNSCSGIAIGLARKSFSVHTQVGCTIDSYAYLSNGKHLSNAQTHTYASPYSVGDTIGCGTSDYPVRGSVYFCKNGEFLGFAFQNITSKSASAIASASSAANANSTTNTTAADAFAALSNANAVSFNQLHATVSLTEDGETVSVNLGLKSFMFDINREPRLHALTLKTDLVASRRSSSKINKSGSNSIELIDSDNLYSTRLAIDVKTNLSNGKINNNNANNGTTNKISNLTVDTKSQTNTPHGLASPSRLLWQRGNVLGHGAYGTVYLGLNSQTGELMAAKKLNLMGPSRGGSDSVRSNEVRKHMNQIKKEIRMLQSLQHPHIVRYLGAQLERDEDASTDTEEVIALYIFLEYIAGGSLDKLLRKFGAFKEPTIRRYTKQILMGLQYLHEQKVIHRDIKGGNILLAGDGTIKLTDFGASKRIDNVMSFSSKDRQYIRGTPYWMAPEVVMQTGVFVCVRACMWCMCCVCTGILYVCMCDCVVCVCALLGAHY